MFHIGFKYKKYNKNINSILYIRKLIEKIQLDGKKKKKKVKKKMKKNYNNNKDSHWYQITTNSLLTDFTFMNSMLQIIIK